MKKTLTLLLFGYSFGVVAAIGFSKINNSQKPIFPSIKKENKNVVQINHVKVTQQAEKIYHKTQEFTKFAKSQKEVVQVFLSVENINQPYAEIKYCDYKENQVSVTISTDPKTAQDLSQDSEVLIMKKVVECLSLTNKPVELI